MRSGIPIITLVAVLIVACVAQLKGYVLPPAPSLAWNTLPDEIVPPLVFLFRTADLTLATLRTLTVVHGRKTTAWFLAIFQSSLFVIGVAGVLGNLDNPWNLFAYAAGFAFGNVLGIAIEARLAPGHNLLRITSSYLGEALCAHLRGQGYGVTELAGTGMKGTVSVILTYVPRRIIERVKREIIAIDPQAFITVEYVRQLRGGWRA